jgi:hemerythrin-like domain-containing protein
MTILDPSTDCKTAAIETIKQEHRALSQVVELLRHLLRDIASGYTEADYQLLALALYYIDEFPGRLHHAKEDKYLFAALQRHTEQFDPLLGRLDSEHERDRETIRDLHRLLVLSHAGAPGAITEFRAAVEDYAATLYEHMRSEEGLVTACGEHLTDDEWRAIADAFAQDKDPLFGSERRREFALLHHRIVNLLPRKMRVGAAAVEESSEEH